MCFLDEHDAWIDVNGTRRQTFDLWRRAPVRLADESVVERLHLVDELLRQADGTVVRRRYATGTVLPVTGVQILDDVEPTGTGAGTDGERRPGVRSAVRSVVDDEIERTGELLEGTFAQSASEAWSAWANRTRGPTR